MYSGIMCSFNSLCLLFFLAPSTSFLFKPSNTTASVIQTALAFKAGLHLLLVLGTGHAKARISDSASPLDNLDFPESLLSFHSSPETNEDDEFMVLLQISVG